MDEILRKLQAGSRVLDLGCAGGSFPRQATPADVVRVDLQVPKGSGDGAWFVQCDAARLPFADGTYAAVISNHSLEHFVDLPGVLGEIGRVIRPGGSLFVAVPDASTLTDRIYRWLGRGGGHLNAFTSPASIVVEIVRATGLPHVWTRVLCSSLSFLNRRNTPRPLPRRLLFLGGGYEWSLFLYAWISRRLDQIVHTRTSIYGWAFYFGNIVEPIDADIWVNVCLRCGSGFSASFLRKQARVNSNVLGLRIYQCPRCGARNPFAEDQSAYFYLHRT